MARLDTAEPETSAALIAVKCIYIIMCMAVGFTGNLSVMVAIRRNKKLQTVPNYFVLNLALADFLFVCIGLPSILVTNISKGWILGEFLCDAVGFLNSLFCVASIYTLVMISVNRYLNVAKARDIKKIYTVKRTLAIIACVWMFSILIAIPPILGWSEFRAGSNFCTINGAASLTYSALLGSVAYILPLIFLTVLYLRIFFMLRKHEQHMLKVKVSHEVSYHHDSTDASDTLSHHVDGGYAVTKDVSSEDKKVLRFFAKQAAFTDENNEKRVNGGNYTIAHIDESPQRTSENDNKHERKKRARALVKKHFREVRVTRMLFILVISFFLCWTPFMVAAILYALGVSAKGFGFATLGIMCACLNSVINPIIYAVLNRNFRKEFANMYAVCLRR